MERSVLRQLSRLSRFAFESGKLGDERASLSRSCGIITVQGNLRTYQMGISRGQKDDQSSVSPGSEPTSASKFSSKQVPIKSRQVRKLEHVDG